MNTADFLKKHKGDDRYGLQLKGERTERILVINCGSSSLKYGFYNTTDETRHARGLVERIGIDGTRLAHRGPKGDVKRELGSAGHFYGLPVLLFDGAEREDFRRSAGILREALQTLNLKRTVYTK